MKSQNSPWFRIPIALMQRDDLSSNSKLVYAYMLWKYQFFKSSSKDYFESQTTIAAQLDISRWTVNQSIAQLQELNLLSSRRKAGDTSGSPCIYTVPDVYGTYASTSSEGDYNPSYWD